MWQRPCYSEPNAGETNHDRKAERSPNPWIMWQRAAQASQMRSKRTTTVNGNRIRDLSNHPSSYVTTSELADYWLVSRKQIYKQIEAGTLKAIRLGPRLLRINTDEAREFERTAKMVPPKPPDSSPSNPPRTAERHAAKPPQAPKKHSKRP
jgi:excisionase family DNA binding protein